MEPWALHWSLCWSESIFTTTGFLNLIRGSFDLPGESTWLTFYARIFSWVEGTASIQLRQGMVDNAEFSGGVLFRTLNPAAVGGLIDSDFRSLVDIGGVGALNPRHNMLAIYNPHFTVRLSVALGGGGSAVFGYEVWAAALIVE